MKKKIDPVIIVFICIAGVLWLYVLFYLFLGFPIPRGSKVDDRYSTFIVSFIKYKASLTAKLLSYK